MVARGFRAYLRLRPGLRAAVETLLEARSLEDQREIYDAARPAAVVGARA